MIVYLDTSALVKRYVQELGSDEMAELFKDELLAGTSSITFVEMAAALAKSERTGALSRADASAVLSRFRSEWNLMAHIRLNEPLIARAASVAWDHGLRGYDATHLASAFFWQELLGQKVCLVTYDRQLWKAAKGLDMETFPEVQP